MKWSNLGLLCMTGLGAVVAVAGLKWSASANLDPLEALTTLASRKRKMTLLRKKTRRRLYTGLQWDRKGKPNLSKNRLAAVRSRKGPVWSPT